MKFLAHDEYSTWLADDKPKNKSCIQLTWNHNNMSLIHNIMDLEPEQLEEFRYE